MRQCVFPTCKSRPDDRIGNVALVHRFPKEEHIRKLWIQWIKEKCGLPDFEFNHRAGLCYRHFERHCYHRSNGLLKPFSYPSFTPQDLDNISAIGSSSREISINGVPKTNLIIKVDPTLLKKDSTPEKSNAGKKFVLLVTDQGIQTGEAPKSNLSLVTQKQPAAGLIRSQDVPPLRFIGREKPARMGVLSTPENMSSPTKQNTICLLKPELPGGVTGLPHSLNFVPVQKNVNITQVTGTFPNQCAGGQQSSAECLPRRKSLTGASKSRTLNLLQTVLDSSRKRLRGYRRRLQLERRRMSRIEELLEEMKEAKLISVPAAARIESILNDE